MVDEQDGHALGQRAQSAARARRSRRCRGRRRARPSAPGAGAGRQRAGDADELAAAVGQLGRQAVGDVGQPHSSSAQSTTAASDRRPSSPDRPEPEAAATSRFSSTVRSSNSSTDCHVRSHAGPRPLVRAEIVDVVAAEADRPGRGHDSPSARRSSSSCRRRSGRSGRPARRRDREVDVVDGGHAAEPDAQVPDRQRVSPSVTGPSPPPVRGAGRHRHPEPPPGPAGPRPALRG